MKDSFQILRLIPTDTLFFGGGRSFTKGQSSWHQSRLLPYPSVFFGAICSVMLEKNPIRCKEYLERGISASDPRKFLEIGAVYLYKKSATEKSGTVYLPAPRDLFIDESNRIHYGQFCTMIEGTDCSLQDVTYYLHSPKKDGIERADNMFIKRSNFLNSYVVKRNDFKLISFNDIANYNYKVGIARDDKLKALDGHLYRLDLIELDNAVWSYLVEYSIDPVWWKEESPSDLGQGILKIGGEGKSCLYEQFEDKHWCQRYEKEMNIINDSEYIKIYFTSPTIFKDNNWKPDLGSSNIEVIAGVTSAPYAVGGFDMVLKKPKPMRKVIPEGCVYILKSSSFKGISCKAIKKKISDLNIYEDSNIGYGQFEVMPLVKNQIRGVSN